eukprot:Rhum_TRINITY_DN5903_c0_g1::Rhum_TRINITY_DN5903_c0_g1_i1::g.18700::m.18700/K01611/speD, AMD1; S-adenosylmethionine decarboxylase
MRWLAIAVAACAVLTAVGPHCLRALLRHSILDDDLAEHCYTPSLDAPNAYTKCVENATKPHFPQMDNFPTGGSQVLCDGYGADPALLNNNTALLQMLNSASTCCGSEVLTHADHHFDPQGATILGLLSTSHYAVHTWPERNAFTLDVYFCTPEAREQVVLFSQIFCEAVKAENCCFRIVRRPLL